MKNNKTIICVTGLPGSGKSIFCKVGERSGYKIIVMGDQIRNQAKKRGLSNNAETLSKLMIELRENEGKDIVAKLCLNEIQLTKNYNIIIDGIRNKEEIKLFKKIGNVSIILIESTTEQRIKFLQKRARSDAPINYKSFNERDKKELKIGLNSIINSADITVSNINLTEKEFINKSKKILLRLIRE